MVKVTKTIYVEGELVELLKAKGVGLSKFVNEALSTLLMTHNPDNWDLMVKHKTSHIREELAKKEADLAHKASELAALKAKLRQREEKEQKDGKKDEKGVVSFTPEQIERMSRGEF